MWKESHTAILDIVDLALLVYQEEMGIYHRATTETQTIEFEDDASTDEDEVDWVCFALAKECTYNRAEERQTVFLLFDAFG